MPDKVRIVIDGTDHLARSGTVVAAALANAGVAARRSVTGEARTSLCGMGVCNECRVTIDGRPHQRACEIVVHEGMEVRTDG